MLRGCNLLVFYPVLCRGHISRNGPSKKPPKSCGKNLEEEGPASMNHETWLKWSEDYGQTPAILQGSARDNLGRKHFYPTQKPPHPL